MAKYKVKVNPHTGQLQIVLDEHTHKIEDIENLQEDLEKIKIKTGYFAN